MSIYGAMFAGVSGLSAQSNALGMISDNIANVSTVGYKTVDARFSTLVTQSASKTTHTPGGVRSAPLQRIDRQGLLQSSASETDIAIAGNGFFITNEQASSGGEFLYTRAGSFTRDVEGYLINAGGYYLQGWRLDANGNPVGNTTVLSSLETVNIASLSGTARASTALDIGFNLPSTAGIGDTEQVSVQVYDALGNAHDLTMTFTKAATNDWNYAVGNPTLSSSGAVSGTVTAGAAGNITFSGDGTPATLTFPDIDITWTLGGAAASTLTIDPGTVAGSDGITQFAGSFVISFLDQDGVRFGQFSSVTIGDDGTVTALFDNGEQRDIYRLPVALFANTNGLDARDGNAWVQGEETGDLTMVVANTSGAGKVASGALEASTVDIADELTKMIITQRAYSASARIISVSDEMLEELVRLGR